MLTKGGGKADGISLSYGKLRRVTQPDQCPLCLFSPFTSLWGTFKAQTCSRVWGTKRRESTWKQMCEKLRGSVWSGRLRDGEPRFQLLLYIPPATSEGMYEIRRFCDVEDPQMLRMLPLAQRDILYSRCWHAAFMFCEQGHRSKMSDEIRLVDLRFWILRTSVPDLNIRCTTGTKKMMSVFHVCCREKSGSQAWSWEQHRVLMSKTFVWSRNSYYHTLMFTIFLFNLNVLILQIQKHIM